jgi:hypothetical protein
MQPQKVWGTDATTKIQQTQTSQTYDRHHIHTHVRIHITEGGAIRGRNAGRFAKVRLGELILKVIYDQP